MEVRGASSGQPHRPPLVLQNEAERAAQDHAAQHLAGGGGGKLIVLLMINHRSQRMCVSLLIIGSLQLHPTAE